MKKNDILVLEEQLEILEKESIKLEKAYLRSDEKEFLRAKTTMLEAHRKIKGAIK